MKSTNRLFTLVLILKMDLPLVTFHVISTRMPSRTVSTFVHVGRETDRRGLPRISPRIARIIPHRRVPSRSLLFVLLLLRPNQHPNEEQKGDHRRVFDHRPCCGLSVDPSPSARLPIEQTLAQLFLFILLSFSPLFIFFQFFEERMFEERSCSINRQFSQFRFLLS